MRSISDPNESIITYTGGCSVLKDISVSQPVSSLKLYPDSAPVLSDTVRVQNIFSAPVQLANLLRPFYNHDVPMHPNEELDHRRIHDAQVVTPPPFLLCNYMDPYPILLDVGRLHCIPKDGNELQVRDNFGDRCDTAVAG